MSTALLARPGRRRRHPEVLDDETPITVVPHVMVEQTIDETVIQATVYGISPAMWPFLVRDLSANERVVNVTETYMVLTVELTDRASRAGVVDALNRLVAVYA